MRFKEFMQNEDFGASARKFGVMGAKPGVSNPISQSIKTGIKSATPPKKQKSISVAKRSALKPARPSGFEQGTIKSVL